MSFRFECINNYTIWTDHLLCEPYPGFIYFSQSRVWLLFGSILWSSVLSNYPYLLCSVRTQGAVAPSSCQLPAAGVSSHDVSVTLMSASIHVLIYFDWDYSSKVEVLRFRWCWSYITKEILLLFKKKRNSSNAIDLVGSFGAIIILFSNCNFCSCIRSNILSLQKHWSKSYGNWGARTA